MIFPEYYSFETIGDSDRQSQLKRVHARTHPSARLAGRDDGGADERDDDDLDEAGLEAQRLALLECARGRG